MTGNFIADKNHPKIIAPPPLISLVSLLLGIGIHYYYPIHFIAPLARYPLGFGILTLSLFLAIWSVKQFRVMNTPVSPYKSSKGIITSGPFRFTRNPLYLVLSILQIGIAILLDNLWAGLTTILAFLLFHYGVVLREEKYLFEIFGEEFLKYKRSVRRWL